MKISNYAKFGKKNSNTGSDTLVKSASPNNGIPVIMFYNENLLVLSRNHNKPSVFGLVPLKIFMI